MSKISKNINKKETFQELEKNPDKYIAKLSTDELVKLLEKFSDSYYNGTALVSDNIFDDMKDELLKRDPNNKFLQQVGAPVKGTKEKVILPFEMGSLNKIKHGKDDITGWMKKYPGKYLLSDKLDGASAQIYKNQTGQVFMFTRGDGTTGQNISHLLNFVISKKTMESMPIGISVRGELIISKTNFKKIADKMKNARNTVSGLVNSKTVDIEIARMTEFITYSIMNPRYDNETQMKMLTQMGFKVVHYQFEKKISVDFLADLLKDRREKSDYEMDGIVCVDSSKIRPHAGGYQDHEFAFKVDKDGVETEVTDVVWNPSKDGYLYPTVHIEPVDIDGTTCSKATGKNAKFIVSNNIGIGAIVKIKKGGDVIPDIIEIVKPAKEPTMPTIPYKWNNTQVNIILQDENDENGKQIVAIKLITNFFAKLGIKYLGEGIVTKIVENGYDTIASVLSAKKKDLCNIDGLGEKNVDKIFAEIDRAFAEMNLETFMAASNKLGRGLGSKKIAEIINVYPNIMNEPEAGLYDKIMLIPGFSDISTKLFVENFKSFKDFYNQIAKIKDLSRFANTTVKTTGDKFKGKIFVFTGTRDEDIQNYIIENGGKVTTSVSSKTTFLIHADDADTSTNKFVKAKDVGVQIIKISDFKKKYTNLT